jgi:hypothetical protein
MSEKLVPKRQYTDEFKVEAIGSPNQSGSTKPLVGSECPWQPWATGFDVAAVPRILAKSAAAK